MAVSGFLSAFSGAMSFSDFSSFFIEQNNAFNSFRELRKQTPQLYFVYRPTYNSGSNKQNHGTFDSVF